MNEKLTALIEKLKADLIMTAAIVNRFADEKDTNRNHVNYGVAINCADVLRILGEEAEVCAWENNGFLIVSKVTINGKITEL